MLQKIYQHVYFPFYEGVVQRRKTAFYYRKLNESQWLSEKVLQSKQLESINSLLEFAQNNSSYYSEVLKNKISLKHLSGLSSVPILTKDIIKNRFDQLVTIPHKGTLWKKSTGGSTGQPVHFGYTQKSYEWRFAISKRGYSWAGGGPGSKQAYIWGIQLGNNSHLQKIKEKILQFLDRQVFFNCFDFGIEEMARCLAYLEKWQPDVIVGYTNPLYEFALFVDKVGGGRIRPRSVICAAEKVHMFQREVIERVFGCPVFNTYGSREFMLIAAECEKHQGLHVSMENLIVEIVDNKGKSVNPGEVGKVLVTDLHNYGMPFIRYEIGDMARLSDRQCSCGRGLILLDDVVGRQLDLLRTPEGRTIPGEFFPHLMKDFKEIERFQVVQREPDSLDIKLQLFDEFNEESFATLERLVRDIVGSRMKLNFITVDKIHLTPTGKYRVTISELR